MTRCRPCSPGWRCAGCGCVSPEVERIASLDGVVRHEASGDGTTTFYAQDSDRLIVELVRSGIPFSELAVRGATLEEAFLTLTEDAPEGVGRADDASEAEGARS